VKAKEDQMPNRMDSMLSHGMGKMKKMKAVLTGLVGVFRVIAEQHGEVAMLLERAKTSDEKFAELWPMIRRELLSHEKAEVQEVFPLLRGNAETVGFANHHDTEAGELEALIARIDAAPINSGVRKETYQQLVDTVLHHAREEESEIFPAAQKALGKEAVEALEPRFLEAKRRVAEATSMTA